MAEPFFGQSFWQDIAGSAIVNLLWSLGIGAAVTAFLKYVSRVAWQRRQLVIGWSAFAVIIFFTLEAIRYNTVSAKESTIRSLRASVAELNRRLAHWRVSEEQRKCLVLALTEMPVGSVRLYVNIGDGEALNFANSLVDPLAQSRWRTNFAGSTPYPMPGLWILVNNANGPLPKDAENLGGGLFRNVGFRSQTASSPISFILLGTGRSLRVRNPTRVWTPDCSTAGPRVCCAPKGRQVGYF